LLRGGGCFRALARVSPFVIGFFALSSAASPCAVRQNVSVYFMIVSLCFYHFWIDIRQYLLFLSVYTATQSKGKNK
jgi:hypothetical protein